MSVTIAIESFSEDLLEEAMPLLREHWKEVALYQSDVPLSVDAGFYKSLASKGSVLCLTVRVQGRLMGYAVFFITSHPHYQELQVFRNDVIYLHPQYRGKTAIVFIRECERACMARKIPGRVAMLTWHAKLSNTFSSLLTHLGYDTLELLQGKLL